MLHSLTFQEISVPNTQGLVLKILSTLNNNKNVPYRNLKNLQIRLSSFLFIKKPKSRIPFLLLSTFLATLSKICPREGFWD